MNPDSVYNFSFLNDLPEVNLILSPTGFTYNGEKIEDAGEAYKLFMRAMSPTCAGCIMEGNCCRSCVRHPDNQNDYYKRKDT